MPEKFRVLYRRDGVWKKATDVKGGFTKPNLKDWDKITFRRASRRREAGIEPVRSRPFQNQADERPRAAWFHAVVFQSVRSAVCRGVETGDGFPGFLRAAFGLDDRRTAGSPMNRRRRMPLERPALALLYVRHTVRARKSAEWSRAGSDWGEGLFSVATNLCEGSG